MACHAARRLADMNDNLAHILGIELLVAAQGVECRKHPTSKPLQRVIKALRRSVERLGPDRYMANDLMNAAALILNGNIAAAARAELGADDLPSLAAF